MDFGGVVQRKTPQNKETTMEKSKVNMEGGDEIYSIGVLGPTT
jgi:hypothetical protein